MRIAPHRSIDELAWSLLITSMLVAGLGLIVIVAFGYLNPLRFARYFIAIGAICLFIPGVCGIVGGLFLRRRAPWAWLLAVLSCAVQLIVAGAAFIAQFFLSPISAVPLIACGAWALASGYLVVQLIRFRPALASDADYQRGFTVEHF